MCLYILLNPLKINKIGTEPIINPIEENIEYNVNTQNDVDEQREEKTREIVPFNEKIEHNIFFNTQNDVNNKPTNDVLPSLEENNIDYIGGEEIWNTTKQKDYKIRNDEETENLELNIKQIIEDPIEDIHEQ